MTRNVIMMKVMTELMRTNHDEGDDGDNDDYDYDEGDDSDDEDGDHDMGT